MSSKTREQVSDLLLWSDESAFHLMERIAEEHSVSVNALAELVAWERESQFKQRKSGMTETFDSVFNNSRYWRK